MINAEVTIKLYSGVLAADHESIWGRLLADDESCAP